MTRSRTSFQILLIVLLALMLSSCSSGTLKKLRPLAEDCLKTLSEKTGIQDSFTLNKGALPDKASDALFEVRSETFDDTFTVSVGRDGTVTDSYYCLSLKKEAYETVLRLLRETADDPALEADVSPVPRFSPDLSARSFESLKDLYGVSGDAMMLTVRITGTSDGKSVSDETKDSLIRALLKEGYYCTFYPYLSDSVWYEITGSGIWETVRTGADGGKMLNRTEYELK